MLDKSDAELIQHTTDGYNTIADEWDQTRRQPWAEINTDIEKYLKDGQKIIDVGCGNGRSLFILDKYKDLEYLGIDPSEKLIEKAKQNFPGKVFETFDGVNFGKYNKNYYDVVLCIAAVHHVPESMIVKWLADIVTLLKKDGTLILTSWDVIGGKSADLLDNENKGLLPFMHYKNIRFVKSYTKEELENYLKNSGLNILESKYSERESKEKNIVIVSQRRV